MVKAKLPELQISGPEARQQHTDGLRAVRRRACATNDGARQGRGEIRESLPTQPRRPILLEDKDRTEHLTASHLLDRVNTGSPKRAALNGPAWRRSRHNSQMPGTAAATRTIMAETIRATGLGTPADRVKGGAFARSRSFRTTLEVR
jgi:hypothetical protein